MPSNIKPEQAAHFAKALARGEADGSKIAMTLIKDQVRQLI
jgi:hypothetical protein